MATENIKIKMDSSRRRAKVVPSDAQRGGKGREAYNSILILLVASPRRN